MREKYQEMTSVPSLFKTIHQTATNVYFGLKCPFRPELIETSRNGRNLTRYITVTYTVPVTVPARKNSVVSARMERISKPCSQLQHQTGPKQSHLKETNL